MSEAGYVEYPILRWLSGYDGDIAADRGLGWTYRDETAMAEFARPLEDPLVERLYLMSQRTRWGNCSAKGNLSFNWRLIMAPDFVLKYLVTLEVVHLAIPNHSKRYWLAVQSYCPDMEKAKRWLKDNHHLLLVDLAMVCAPSKV